MEYRLGVEDIEKSHWIAWALDLPACYSSARTKEEAITMAPTRISQHFVWLRNHGAESKRIDREEIKVNVVETFNSFVSEGMYVVNAFFEDDCRPLSPEDVFEGLWLLKATRDDLMDVIQSISPEKLHRPIPGEMQGSIAGILEHIAWAEWWYFDNINQAFDRERMPSDPLEMLAVSRAHTQAILPKLVNDTNQFEQSAELWSARKVLRRALWHERDHTQHIEKVLVYI